MRLQKDSGQNNDNFAETKDKQGAEADQPDKSNGYSEPDSLDDVFKMLDLPSFDPKDGVSSRIMENKQQVDGNKLNGNQDDIDMQGLFKELDRNNDFSDSSRSNIKRSISFNDGNEQSKADPMDEFEKILKDLADEDTEVFRSDNPAPFFWDKAASKSLSTKGKGSKDDYLDNLNPDTLFEDGPRASAFSAEKLAGDPNRISKIAARIVEDAKLTKHINEQQEQQARQSKAF
ncbi:hypothetical protein J3B02_001715 [Coemansia erecta]|nr:hypothetical protein J3B02_001715 [Coemansia erecta]